MPRFDEVELEAVPFDIDVVPDRPTNDAPRFKRLAALVIDVSLFAALVLALSPLLPASQTPLAVGALAGFVVVVSYYYYAGTWLLWGKTVGGAIFDVRVIPAHGAAMSLKNATLRWLGLYLSLATGGIGFLLAALPSRRSLADRMSRTRCVAA
jgi:uncharacterized RDD family membrane protein YckC